MIGLNHVYYVYLVSLSTVQESVKSPMQKTKMSLFLMSFIMKCAFSVRFVVLHFVLRQTRLNTVEVNGATQLISYDSYRNTVCCWSICMSKFTKTELDSERFAQLSNFSFKC